MKIIFDRSAFHGEDFDLLKSSRLSELVREREVLVFHTMVLLEETLRMIEAHEDELKRQWPFLRSICNAGWFKPLLLAQPPELKSVCEEELDGDNKDDNWPVVPSKYRSVVEAQLDNIIAGTASLSEVDNAKEKWDQNHRAKDCNKKLLRHFRERPFIRKGQSFAEYYQVSRDANASILSGQLASSRPSSIFGILMFGGAILINSPTLPPSSNFTLTLSMTHKKIGMRNWIRIGCKIRINCPF